MTLETITTPRLSFRRFTPADIDLLVDLDSDPEVMRWLTGGKPSSREYYEQAMPRIMRWYETGPSRGFFAAEEVVPADDPGARKMDGWHGCGSAQPCVTPRTGEAPPVAARASGQAIDARARREFIGWFHLRDAHHWPGQLELGYRLKRSAWGRGLATEGSVALIRHALDDLGEPLVVAATMLGNTASQRVMQKAGMQFDHEFLETRWEGADKRAVKYTARAQHTPG
jgi:RimJ/RimL family protein N-acetyltransferase